MFKGGHPSLTAWLQDSYMTKEESDAKLAMLAGSIQAQVLAQAERDRDAIIAATTDAAVAAAVSTATDKASAAAIAAATAAASAAAANAAAAAVTEASDLAAAKAASEVAAIAAATAIAEIEKSKDSASVAAGAAILGSFAGAGLSEEVCETKISTSNFQGIQTRVYNVIFVLTEGANSDQRSFVAVCCRQEQHARLCTGIYRSLSSDAVKPKY